MGDAPKDIGAVPVSRVFLSLTNPRHEEVTSEAEAIAYLCAKEDVYPLARDIAKLGSLNPLESFALVPVGRRKGSTETYYAAEGNRRLCALKLLNDPDLAPAKLRRSFEKLSASWTPIKTVRGTVFKDFDGVRVWLDRIHNGPQGGIGRRSWGPEQKSRFYGGNKNKAAQAFLDYAESQKLISAEEREGKLTTVQRFVGNEIFREAIGFDQSNIEDVARTRPKPDFDVMVKRFIRDLVGKEDVNSRMNSKEIVQYSRTLLALPGVTATRIPAESLTTPNGIGKKKASGRKRPGKPEKAKHVRYEEAINTALRGLGNEKLSSLYYSICSIELEHNTPIVAVGTWSFFETLTACAGRNDGTSFDSFLSNQRLNAFGITEVKPLRQAMERIRDCGNTTKHNKVAALFNGDQLNNDVVALKDVILKCIELAAAPKP